MRLKYCSESFRRFCNTRSRLPWSSVDSREFNDRLARGFEQSELSGGQGGPKRVERFFAFAAVADKTSLTQQCELRGDARLGHAEDFL